MGRSRSFSGSEDQYVSAHLLSLTELSLSCEFHWFAKQTGEGDSQRDDGEQKSSAIRVWSVLSAFGRHCWILFGSELQVDLHDRVHHS